MNAVTKSDMKHVAYAYPGYHIGAIFQELIEIFDDDKEYNLIDIANTIEGHVWKDYPAIYVSESEYNTYSDEYKEKHPMKKVGDKYEFMPRRVFRYEMYLIPLFISATICGNTNDKRVIVMVTDNIMRDYNVNSNRFQKVTSWDGATQKQIDEATLLYDLIIRE